MELLQAMSGGLVAAASVFIVAWLGKERYDARFDAVQAELVGVHTAIQQLHEDARQTRNELATLRSDLLNVALRTRPEAG